METEAEAMTGDVKMLPQRDFGVSFAAYKADLEKQLNREASRDEVTQEMMKFGWEFWDSSGKIDAEDSEKVVTGR